MSVGLRVHILTRMSSCSDLPHMMLYSLSSIAVQVASVTVIHVPDEKYTLSGRILFQYLLTAQGNMYELKV